MRTRHSHLRTGRTYWQSRPWPRMPVAPLRADHTTDVLVTGAGITGAMAAEALTTAGMRVTLVDRRGPLQDATAATTALLQYEIDTPLTVLQRISSATRMPPRLGAGQEDGDIDGTMLA